MNKLFHHFNQYFALVTLLVMGVACNNNTNPPEPTPPEPSKYDIDFKMTDALGSYFSKVMEDGSSNFFIVLSDGKLGGDAETTTIVSPGNVAVFDLYVREKTPRILLEGDYLLTNSDAPKSLECSIGFSGYVIQHEVGKINKKTLLRFSEGAVNVSVNGTDYTIEMIGTTEDGKTFRCSYTGPITFKEEAGTAELPPIEEDIKTTFLYTNANYMGLDEETGAAHFIIKLADFDIATTMGGVLATLDIYADPATVPTTIAAGHYVVSDKRTKETFLPGVFNLNALVINGTHGELMKLKKGSDDDYEILYGMIAGGSVDISMTGQEYTISINLVDNNNYKLVGTYKGVIPIRDQSFHSKLEADKVVDLTNMPAGTYYYGDYYKVNGDNWLVMLGSEADNTDAMQIDLLCPRGSFEQGLPAGKYMVTSSDYTEGAYVCLPGVLRGGSELHFTWLLGDMHQGVTYTEAPAMEGSVDVVRAGDEYTFTFEFWDDAPQKHKFSGTWSGRPKKIDGLSTPAPARVQRAEARTALSQPLTVAAPVKSEARAFPRSR